MPWWNAAPQATRGFIALSFPAAMPRSREDRDFVRMRLVYVEMLAQRVEAVLKVSLGPRLAPPPPGPAPQPHWRRRGGRAVRAVPCPPQDYVVEVQSILVTTDLVTLPISHR